MPPIASNRYELLDKIAKGGMAEVYRARRLGNRNYDSLVAVKRILPERAEETGFVEMLIDEARITSQLKHPNIAQLYELACDETGYFIVMELLLGPNLAALIDKLKVQGRHLPQACAVEAIIQLLKALDYAHNKCDPQGHPLHLVHRDISPDNLLLGPSGDVKLIDFGVAKAKDRLADKTKAGMIKGKFSYLAPERLRSSISDPRSDLFSAALVLWEALAGRIRFDAEDDRDLLEQIETNRSPSFREMGIDIPAQLESILNTALATDPNDRFQTAAEFLEALDRYQRKFNPGDNSEALGKLVSSAFKSELRWLDDALEKFRTGRLKPLGVIGGGVVEDRFQISKRSTSAQRATSFRLKKASKRRPQESPFEEVPYLDSPAQREETSVFKDNGIQQLSDDDFEEDVDSAGFDLGDDDESESTAKARRLGAKPQGKASAAPHTPPKKKKNGDRPALSEVLEGTDANGDASRPKHQGGRSNRHDEPELLPLAKNDLRTKTRMFNFGEGASVKFTFDPKKAVVLACAILGGILLFLLLLNMDVIGSLPLPDPPQAPGVSQGSAAAPQPAQGFLRETPAPSGAAAPAANNAGGLGAPAASSSPTARTAADAHVPSTADVALPAAPAPVHQASTAADNAGAKSANVAKKKPAKKKNTRKRRKAVKAKKKAPARKKAPAADDGDISLDDDDDFFESDEAPDVDEDDEEEEAPPSKRRGASSQSAADDAFDDDF